MEDWRTADRPGSGDLETIDDSSTHHDAKLRLDANGGLTDTQAEQWLEICSRESKDRIYRATSSS